MSKTYECVICHGVNHSTKLHCQYCGTIPQQYSMIGVPSVFHQTDDGECMFIEVLVAFGARRLESSRTAKHQFRTVPMDYYAVGE